MHLPLKALLLTAVFCSSTSAQASTWPSFIEGQPAPDAWLQISLNETDSFGLQTNLTERTNVQICERIITAAGACAAIGSFVIAFAQAMGSTIKQKSNEHSCSSVRGTYESVSWIYYATGRNCDTTAQRETIAGAVKKYLHDVKGNKLCGTECLRFDHGGTWDGWLKLGPTSNYNEGA